MNTILLYPQEYFQSFRNSQNCWTFSRCVIYHNLISRENWTIELAANNAASFCEMQSTVLLFKYRFPVSLFIFLPSFSLRATDFFVFSPSHTILVYRSRGEFVFIARTQALENLVSLYIILYSDQRLPNESPFCIILNTHAHTFHIQSTIWRNRFC